MWWWWGIGKQMPSSLSWKQHPPCTLLVSKSESIRWVEEGKRTEETEAVQRQHYTCKNRVRGRNVLHMSTQTQTMEGNYLITKLFAGRAPLTQCQDRFMEFHLADSSQQSIQMGTDEAVYTPSKTQASIIMSEHRLLTNLQKEEPELLALKTIFTLTYF